MDKTTNWQTTSSVEALPLPLKPWLLYGGSFMDRLREFGVADPQVQVLYQDWQAPFACEQCCLKVDSQALVREVLIISDKTVWMYARSVFPRDTLTGEYEKLAHLENRSLGSVLFNDPTIQRGEFEIASFEKGSLWFEKVAAQIQIDCQTLWGRRSLFDLKGKQLLLTEIFLPKITELS
ncbi:MAG: chorismate--pyruvate lyase family protein [Gammaproteobacteria bacterium]